MTTNPGFAAKPIVRRDDAKLSSAPDVRVLLTIPDLRRPVAVAGETQSEALAEALRDVTSDVNESGPSVAPVDVAPDISVPDFDAPRSEFGIAPPKNVIGGNKSTSAVDETSVTKSKASPHTADAPVSSISYDMMSSGLPGGIKRHLRTLGTIAAAILACTLIARSMKQDAALPKTSLLAGTNEVGEQLTDLVDNAAQHAEQVSQGFEQTIDEANRTLIGAANGGPFAQVARQTNEIQSGRQPTLDELQAVLQPEPVGPSNATATGPDPFQQFQREQFAEQPVRQNANYANARDRNADQGLALAQPKQQPQTNSPFATPVTKMPNPTPTAISP